MENFVLSHLEPESVFRFFEELSRIPRESGHTGAVSAWVEDFAKERGLPCRRDGLGNVIIWKDAAAGYEDHPPVILQGHVDMVCVKDPGADHDFARDPLRLVLDGDWLRAGGTTLGGDDGAAVAMMLALLDDTAIPHPPIEAVFTVDEEIGLLGAAGLDCSDLKGRTLINLDSEAEGVLTVGCAGGARCDLDKAFSVQETSGIRYTVRVIGGQGGHSGTEIHMGHANANKLLGQCLAGLDGIRLASLCGGGQDNVIPKEAEAVFFSDAPLDPDLPEAVWTAYAETEPALELEVSGDVDLQGPALSVEDSRKVLDLILSAPNGVQAMEPDLPGQVRTSLNLGILRLEEGKLHLTWSVRSSAAREKEDLIAALKALAEGCGGTFGRRGDYPAWEYRSESRLRDVMVRVWRERAGKEPVVETIHAGLECGLLAEKLPGLDAVSIGPDMRDIHSPRERLSVSSVRRTWNYLLAVLAQL